MTFADAAATARAIEDRVARSRFRCAESYVAFMDELRRDLGALAREIERAGAAAVTGRLERPIQVAAIVEPTVGVTVGEETHRVPAAFVRGRGQVIVSVVRRGRNSSR